jgi:hypothetical protein
LEVGYGVGVFKLDLLGLFGEAVFEEVLDAV